MSTTVSVQPFGTTVPGAVIYTLKHGILEVRATNIGASITHFIVTNPKTGVARDTVFGFDDALPYKDGTSPSCGAIVGRVANRIANAQFELDGIVYHLDKNNGNHTLHGGLIGFGRRLWKHEGFVTEKGASVRFTYHSVDDEEGFPGTVDSVVTYTVLKNGEFTVEMTATVGGKATPVNLANHTYWNLAGHDSGDVRGHWLVMNADSYTPTDSELIPTGKIDPVAGTALDFTKKHKIGYTIDKAGGYDNNYVINKHKKPLDGEWPGLLEEVKDVVLAVEVSSPAKDLSLEIYTDAPGVQFYTANGVNNMHGKGGAVYQKYGAYCFETQDFPNAINEPAFPSSVLRPGEVYTHVMLCRFLCH
eukprot:TRINITY_DN12078_c0_g2_i3.p1 TRINITY_DN12078_c0_g2~~TRINITY_DN12078_c0_g2_i3.p1  ORF type:complete len:361 (+),score=64.79 TRINITY_DN12078_c0_g2_i3:401-1483(+)